MRKAFHLKISFLLLPKKLGSHSHPKSVRPKGMLSEVQIYHSPSCGSPARPPWKRSVGSWVSTGGGAACRRGPSPSHRRGQGLWPPWPQVTWHVAQSRSELLSSFSLTSFLPCLQTLELIASVTQKQLPLHHFSPKLPNGCPIISAFQLLKRAAHSGCPHFLPVRSPGLSLNCSSCQSVLDSRGFAEMGCQGQRA